MIFADRRWIGEHLPRRSGCALTLAAVAILSSSTICFKYIRMDMEFSVVDTRI
jgi:hypothetical protein